MEYKIKNANYERVLSIIHEFLHERYRHVCSCPRCISDIAALALNYLPPHYYVEDQKDMEVGSPWVMVETAVVEAIERVIEHPSHPQEAGRRQSRDVSQNG
jgi:competence protein ComFB